MMLMPLPCRCCVFLELLLLYPITAACPPAAPPPLGRADSCPCSLSVPPELCAPQRQPGAVNRAGALTELKLSQAWQWAGGAKETQLSPTQAQVKTIQNLWPLDNKDELTLVNYFALEKGLQGKEVLILRHWYTKIYLVYICVHICIGGTMFKKKKKRQMVNLNTVCIFHPVWR